MTKLTVLDSNLTIPIQTNLESSETNYPSISVKSILLINPQYIMETGKDRKETYEYAVLPPLGYAYSCWRV